MTTDLGDALDHLTILGGLQDEFLATIPAVDPATPVPWCGRWRVRDLVVHLSRIHHWAAAEARRAKETPLGRGPFVLDELYRSCAAELRETLAALGPDAPSRTLTGTGTASFWRRRQTHETLVHLWDLTTAGGLPFSADPGTWADTVDEVVTVMQPRQERLGRMEPLAAPIGLVAPDAGRDWLLGASTVADPSATVTGPADTLALLLWGRATVADERLTVRGDAAALDDALSRRLTP
ncbi:hypothetical protein Cch01nite_06790 [Cellulomonas chitinilytica]|uniref:Mycothiol-dependent maleylpyruvate isomerase metal-binding domain-containing protein n=1 Tax=Cellulomonas chitinilytica TaxID=398759 RepID=A0A919TXX1_9CELL|nr:maleylpyruvate isomerase family mycothiol-dependent enzyme [Cellulomonas chitinilytica]GIG19955.1 hypothetical protein Cch01nite_06790 [Cellulomonas chitinilytica]